MTKFYARFSGYFHLCIFGSSTFKKSKAYNDEEKNIALKGAVFLLGGMGIVAELLITAK